MKLLVQVLFCASVLAAALATGPAPASAADSPCYALIHSRNIVFDDTKKIRQSVAYEQREVSAVQTRITLLSGEAEKAAQKELAEHQRLLKKYKADLVNYERSISNYDELIKQCQAKSTETSAAQWAGRWEGRGWSYNVSAEGSSLEYAFKNTGNGGASAGTGACTISGNTAHCQWKMRNGEGANGIDMTGTETLTLSGDTITAGRTLSTIRCIVQSPDCQTYVGGMSRLIGVTETTEWHRAR
jgi:hypothetical protein